MKKLLIIFAFSILFVTASVSANAHTTQGSTAGDNHTTREETEGKAAWEKLQTKTLNCKDLSDDNFGALGEYFMGTMMDDSHAAMNTMMVQMMGEEGEAQMHIVMGKRLSGCDTSAAFPAGGSGFMPMMQMMMGDSGNSMMGNFGSNPMGWGLGFFGGIFMVLWWILIIVAIVALVKWLTNQFRGGLSGKSPLDILKERYAKGEIDKEEFDSMKKDILR